MVQEWVFRATPKDNHRWHHYVSNEIVFWFAIPSRLKLMGLRMDIFIRHYVPFCSDADNAQFSIPWLQVNEWASTKYIQESLLSPRIIKLQSNWNYKEPWSSTHSARSSNMNSQLIEYRKLLVQRCHLRLGQSDLFYRGWPWRRWKKRPLDKEQTFNERIATAYDMRRTA